MAELKGDRGESLCGWCLTGRCSQCLPGGDGWECTCTHPNIRYQPHEVGGGTLREIKLNDKES